MTVHRMAVGLGTLTACTLLVSLAHAESNAFMRIKGLKQGNIKGSVTQKGREDSIQVIAMEHSIAVPMDAGSGQPAGRRMHKPLVITKELDKSTPALRNAFISNEVLSEVVLQFWQLGRPGTGAEGAEVQYYTIKLKNARVASIHDVMPNNKDPELSRYAAYEELGFSYESITWSWNDGGLAATDDWAAAKN